MVDVAEWIKTEKMKSRTYIKKHEYKNTFGPWLKEYSELKVERAYD